MARLLTTWLLLCPVLAGANGLPKIKGWKRVGAQESYDRKTVYQAINGAAELYLSFGMRSLRQQGYTGKKLSVTVQLYDQGSALGAFGVFARERPPKGEDLAVGTSGAFTVGGDCLAYQGRFYIKVIPTDGKLPIKECGRIVTTVFKTLPGGKAPPKELTLLPSSGRVKGSEGFTRESYLGTRRLRRCVHADYRSGKESYKLFVMLSPPGTKIEAVWLKLAKSWTRTKHKGLKLLAKKLPYRGTVFLARAKGAILGGVGAGDLRSVLKRWKAQLAEKQK